MKQGRDDMGMRFLQDTPLGSFEAMMQQVPRGGKGYRSTGDTYLDMLYRTMNPYKIKGLYKRIKKILGGMDGYEMLYVNKEHKTRFNNFYKHALRNRWSIIKFRPNVAALYLLSSNNELWSQIKVITTEDSILIDKADIRMKGEEVYDIFQAVRFLLHGKTNLTLEDLVEPEILKDEMVLLIANSLIVNKFGIAFLEKYYKNKEVGKNERKS